MLPSGSCQLSASSVSAPRTGGAEERVGRFSLLMGAKRFLQFLILCFKKAHKLLSKDNQPNSLKIKIAL